MELCKEAAVPAPFYSVASHEVILTFPRPERQQGNGNDPKDDPKEKLDKLTDRQRIVLYLIREDNTLTISQMTQKLKVSEKTIKRDIATLQEAGFLVREGGRKDGKWQIII
ncbi:MAG: DeoR family transcriptional regulator [Paludibacteraceae bacterium]|nr:DeoR family transcriptional regulator [Paludibacteraceae bacterium]